MNPRSRKTWMYVILFLIGVGILYQFAINPRGMIIPLAVFGAVYLLYKFPPSRWRQFPSVAVGGRFRIKRNAGRPGLPPPLAGAFADVRAGAGMPDRPIAREHV